MKKIIAVGMIGMAIATSAWACRTWMVTTPDGRTVYCMQCCDSNGNCNVTCN